MLLGVQRGTQISARVRRGDLLHDLLPNLVDRPFPGHLADVDKLLTILFSQLCQISKFSQPWLPVVVYWGRAPARTHLLEASPHPGPVWLTSQWAYSELGAIPYVPLCYISRSQGATLQSVAVVLRLTKIR